MYVPKHLDAIFTKLAHIKFADDLASDKSFEKAFADLALAVQNDSFPILNQKTLGFQLLEKNEDETRAVGVVGLQLGDMVVLAPYFFEDGEIFGNELLWLAEPNIFVPKTDAWISYLSNTKLTDFGRAINPLEMAERVTTPDMTRLRFPYTKTSLAVEPWAIDVLPKLYREILKPKRLLNKRASVAKVPLRPLDILKHASVAGRFLATIVAHPGLIYDLQTFVGDVTNLLKQAAHIVKTATSVLSQVAFDKPIDLNKVGPIKIYTEDDLSDPDLSADDKLRIMKMGYLIKDFRRQFSKVAEIEQIVEQTTKHYVVPDGLLKGEALLDNGSHTEVVFVPVENSNYVRFVVVCPADETVYAGKGSSVETPSFRFFAKSNIGHIFVNVDNIEKDLDAIWTALQRVEGRPAEYDQAVIFVRFPDSIKAYYCPSFQRDDDKIVLDTLKNSVRSIIIESRAKQPFIVRDVLHVGRDDVIIAPLDRKDISEAGFMSPTQAIEKLDLFQAGDIIKLTISSSSKFYYFAGENGSEEVEKKTAALRLMADYGISEQDANRMLKEAERRPVTYFIKLAQPPTPQQAVGAIMPPAPVPGGDFLMGSSLPTLPATEQVATQSQIQALSPIQPPAYAPLNPQLVQQIAQAASTGQKDIFDTTFLKTMLEATDDRDILEQFLPKMMVGVDAIGRLLFNLYWHKDFMENRLGKVDTLKMRQNLQSMFKNLGDAVLTLFEKNIKQIGSNIPELFGQEAS